MRKVLLLLLIVSVVFAGRFPVTVLRVVDGDTIWVLMGPHRYKVRLIGVDAPEVHPGRHLVRQVLRTGKSVEVVLSLGKQATEHLRALINSCKEGIWLETDVQKYDRYGRLLGYLWCGTRFINYEMVRDGYAMVYTFPPNVAYVELLRRAQAKARQERKGLWR